MATKGIANKVFPITSVRNAVKVMAELMEYANSREDGRWAHQSSDPRSNGVFGHACGTIKAIIREIHGEAIADLAIDRLNIGGSGSWFMDFVYAVKDALREHDEANGRLGGMVVMMYGQDTGRVGTVTACQGNGWVRVAFGKGTRRWEDDFRLGEDVRMVGDDEINDIVGETLHARF